MARAPVWNMRLDPADRERWETAAAGERLGLAEFVKAAVEEKIAAAGAPVKTAKKKTSSRAAAFCAKERFHRPGAYCKTCAQSF